MKPAKLPELMQQAIETRKQHQRRAAAIDKILQLRSTHNPVSMANIEQTKQSLRV